MTRPSRQGRRLKRLKAIVSDSQMSKPRNNPEETHEHQNAPSNETGQNDLLRNPLVSSNPSDFKPRPANVDCSQKEQKHGIERWKPWIEVIGIIGGLAGVVVLIGQYHEMIKATDVTQQQLKAMQGQVDEMKRTRNLDERAWIYAKVEDNNLVPDGTNFIFNISVINVGKTPALMTGNITMFTNTITQIPRIDDEVFGIESAIVPNQIGHFPVQVRGDIVSISQFIPIYIYGTLFYKDISGSKHLTQYCFAMTDAGHKIVGQSVHALTDELVKPQN